MAATWDEELGYTWGEASDKRCSGNCCQWTWLPLKWLDATAFVILEMPPQVSQVSVECSSILKRHFKKMRVKLWHRLDWKMGSDGIGGYQFYIPKLAGFGQGVLRQGWQRAFRPWPQCPSSASKWAKCNLAAEGVCKFAPVLRYLWKGFDLARSTLHPTFGSCWFHVPDINSNWQTLSY